MGIEIDVRKTEERTISAVRFTSTLRVISGGGNMLRVVDNNGVIVLSLNDGQTDALIEAIGVARNLWGRSA